MMTVTSKEKREREINWCGDNLNRHTASSRATPPPPLLRSDFQQTTCQDFRNWGTWFKVRICTAEVNTFWETITKRADKFICIYHHTTYLMWIRLRQNQCLAWFKLWRFLTIHLTNSNTMRQEHRLTWGFTCCLVTSELVSLIWLGKRPRFSKSKTKLRESRVAYSVRSNLIFSAQVFTTKM